MGKDARIKMERTRAQRIERCWRAGRREAMVLAAMVVGLYIFLFSVFVLGLAVIVFWR